MEQKHKTKESMWKKTLDGENKHTKQKNIIQKKQTNKTRV